MTTQDFPSQESLTEALTSDRAIAADMREVAGERHPDTLSCMAKLANTLICAEEFAEAGELCARVLELRWRRVVAYGLYCWWQRVQLQTVWEPLTYTCWICHPHDTLLSARRGFECLFITVNNHLDKVNGSSCAALRKQ